MSTDATAELVRRIPTDFGDVRLYRLSEPLNGYLYVRVSAVDHGRAETYIFGADADGNGVSSELPGSFKGAMDHHEALKRAGYTIGSIQAPTTDRTRICESCKGIGWADTYSQPVGQPYADFGRDKCRDCRGKGHVPTYTTDARDLLDEADQRLTKWETRQDPGHALNVRTAGMEAYEALFEAASRLMAHAAEVRAEVDAYDSQEVAFLESVHVDADEVGRRPRSDMRAREELGGAS